MIGYQRFYVEGTGSTAGTLWYCGSLSNYSDSTAEQTGSARLNAFKPVVFPSSSDLNVTFCLDSTDKDVMGPLDLNPFMKGCVTCDCANWTLSYNPATEILSSQMSMSGSEGHTHSKHMWAEMRKIAPPPVVEDSYMPGHGANFSCEFEAGGRDSVPVEREWRALHAAHAQLGGGDGGGTTTGAAIKSITADNVVAPTMNDAKLTVSDASANTVTTSGCPFARLKSSLLGKSQTTAAAVARTSASGTTASSSSDLAHCYTLNERAGYQLAWTLDTDAQTLRCTVSAPVITSSSSSSSATASIGAGTADEDEEQDFTNTTWVAIGFRPLSRANQLYLPLLGTGHHMNFGMEGADIVAGSIGGGVRTMYAALYTGPPTPDDSLKISDATVEVTVDADGANKRVVLSFTRPLVGGYLNTHYNNNASINTGFSDIIWASGLDVTTTTTGSSRSNSSNIGSEGDTGCNYHNKLRGLRFIDWLSPEIAMVDAWKC